MKQNVEAVTAAGTSGVDSASASRLKSLVAEASQILVACHRRPDGDALGSLLGVAALLRGMGKSCVAYCPDPLPPNLLFLPGVETISAAMPELACDLTLLLDTPEEALWPKGFVPQGTFAVIDHHMHCESFGDVIIRSPAAAVGEMVYFLAEAAQWPVGEDAATCLLTSIVSDTASFRYESTTPSTHRAAAALTARGARPADISRYLFDSHTLGRQRLLAAVLDTLETAAGGRYASMHCTEAMLQDAGVAADQLTGMINYARSTAGVMLAALIREEADGRVRVSLRAKGGVDAGDVAGRFGGGGHVNAAGFTVREPLQDVLRRLRQTAEQLWG